MSMAFQMLKSPEIFQRVEMDTGRDGWTDGWKDKHKDRWKDVNNEDTCSGQDVSGAADNHAMERLSMMFISHLSNSQESRWAWLPERLQSDPKGTQKLQ